MGNPEIDRINELKRSAAERAVEFVNSGMILGLGTGSTAVFAMNRLGELLVRGELTDIIAIPTSKETERIAWRNGIPLTTLRDHPVIDLTIDGADEIDPDLNLIKGGGGALLREKIVAEASRQVIIIADDSKTSDKLGTKWVVPVEVIPFGMRPVAEYIVSLGAKVEVREMSEGKPFRTDEGNHILDCRFGPIDNPAELAEKLSVKAGIVEHGLFLGIASDVIIAGMDGIKHLKKNNG